MIKILDKDTKRQPYKAEGAVLQCNVASGWNIHVYTVADLLPSAAWCQWALKSK